MVRIYDDARKFLEEAGAFLLERQAVSQLVYANAVSAGTRPASPDCLFGTVQDEHEINLAFCNCSPWNLVVYSRPVLPEGADNAAGIFRTKEKIAAAAKELAFFLNERKIPVSGINANDAICKSFLAHYDAGGRGVKKKLSMNIMVCSALHAVSRQGGIYRSAAEKDAAWIVNGCLAFEKEALGKNGDRETLREKVINCQIRQNRLRLFCLPDDTPVAMANRTRDLKDGFVISHVYTLPAYRGKGYAQSLIYKMCEEFFKEGYSFATLFVDQTNPVSNRVYEKVGFEIIEDQYDYRF